MMPELRVVRAVNTYRSGKSGIIESLLGIVVRMKAITAFDKIQDPHLRQRKILYIRHLSIGIDGVSEVGRVHILIPYADAKRSRSYL